MKSALAGRTKGLVMNLVGGMEYVNPQLACTQPTASIWASKFCVKLTRTE